MEGFHGAELKEKCENIEFQRKEYKFISEHFKNHPKTFSKESYNYDHDRYSNILPFEINQVKIPHVESKSYEWKLVVGEGGYEEEVEVIPQDVLDKIYHHEEPHGKKKFELPQVHGKAQYINASLIRSPFDGETIELVGTQSPLPSTTSNFFRTIWFL